MPLTVRCGSLMVNPSSPLARISRVTLERTAPGAKERFQSAVACWPVSGLAPDASRRTHPVSLLPSSGHETPLGSAWAETVDKVNNGLMDIKTFPYFINKKAPVSEVESLLDYEVTFIGSIKENIFTNQIKVVVPVTSLCPCSKKISDYGAHNQRSHVTVTVKTTEFVWIEDIIKLVEENASSELYGLLKRPDEKYVTEKAYDNPKFVEDMVRDIATDLNKDQRIKSYVVESENFESIHNHSAYAMIRSN